MTMDLPLIDKPDFTKACSPPTPAIPGKVQPGKGRKISRAPAAMMSFLYRSSRLVSQDSARSVLVDGSAETTCVPANTGTPLRRNRSNQRTGWRSL